MSISPSTKRLKPKPSGCGICSELTDSRVRRHGLDTPPNALLLATVARKARVYLHMNGALTAHLATCICLAGTIVSTTIKQKRPVIGAPYLQPGYKASWTVSSGPPFHSPSLDYYLVYLNSLSELFLDHPRFRDTIYMHSNNLSRQSSCIQCLETVPSCGLCAADEQCVVTSQTCTACASATCVAAPTTASSYELVARNAEKTEIVTLTDSNGTPTATSTIFSTSGPSTGGPALGYGLIAGGVIVLAILGTFFYCTCYKRRARGKLPGYQSFGSESALPKSVEGGTMREVKGRE